MKLSKSDKQWIIGIVLAVLSILLTWYFSLPSKAPQVKLAALSHLKSDYGSIYEPINDDYDTILIVTRLEARQSDFDNKIYTHIFNIPLGIYRDGKNFVDKLRYQIYATPIEMIEDGKKVEIPRILVNEDSIVSLNHFAAKDISLSHQVYGFGEFVQVTNKDLKSDGLIDEFEYFITLYQDGYETRQYTVKNLVFLSTIIDSVSSSSPDVRFILNGRYKKWAPKGSLLHYTYKVNNLKEIPIYESDLKKLAVVHKCIEIAEPLFPYAGRFYNNTYVFLLILCIVLLVSLSICFIKRLITIKNTSKKFKIDERTTKWLFDFGKKEICFYIISFIVISVAILLLSMKIKADFHVLVHLLGD